MAGNADGVSLLVDAALAVDPFLDRAPRKRPPLHVTKFDCLHHRQVVEDRRRHAGVHRVAGADSNGTVKWSRGTQPAPQRLPLDPAELGTGARDRTGEPNRLSIEAQPGAAQIRHRDEVLREKVDPRGGLGVQRHDRHAGGAKAATQACRCARPGARVKWVAREGNADPRGLDGSLLHQSRVGVRFEHQPR